MKRYISVFLAAALCLMALGGCGCRHSWQEATCEDPEICEKCGETQGEPLGHDPGSWQEVRDLERCLVVKFRECDECGELTDREEAQISSLVEGGLYLLTPEQFLDRISMLYGSPVEWVMSDSDALIYIGENMGSQVLAQFFANDAQPLAPGDKETAKVWCASFTTVGEADAALRWAFFMACDPTLDANAALSLDAQLAVVQSDALAALEMFGYYTHNGLLYETACYPAGVMLEDQSVTMFNVYASDFR